MKNEMLMDMFRENAKEVKEKQEMGEKLSFKNYFILTAHILILLCYIAFGYFIISFIVQVLL